MAKPASSHSAHSSKNKVANHLLLKVIVMTGKVELNLFISVMKSVIISIQRQVANVILAVSNTYVSNVRSLITFSASANQRTPAAHRMLLRLSLNIPGQIRYDFFRIFR